MRCYFIKSTSDQIINVLKWFTQKVDFDYIQNDQTNKQT